MAKVIATAERVGKKRGRKPKEQATACVFLRHFNKKRADGSIYEYFGDIYQICYPTVDPQTGKTKYMTKSSGSKLKSEAEAQLTVLKASHQAIVNGGKSAQQRPDGNKTFREFFNEVYLEDADVKALAGYEQIKQQAGEMVGGLYDKFKKDTKPTIGAERVFNEMHIGHIKLKDFTADRFRKYLQVKKDRGNAISTCNKHIALVVRAIHVAFLKGNVGFEAVVESKKLVKEEENNSRINSLDVELIDILREACEKRSVQLRQFVEFCLATGLRKNRAYKLEWTMLDLDKKKIVIPKDKHGKEFKAQLGSTAMKVLHERLDEATKNGPPYVFFNPATLDRWYDLKKSFHHAVKDAIAIAMERNIKPAGLINFKFHDARHTFISSLVNADVAFDKVQELAGHKDARSTKRYTHYHEEKLKEAVEQLPY